jgi:hypothetical protein
MRSSGSEAPEPRIELDGALDRGDDLKYANTLADELRIEGKPVPLDAAGRRRRAIRRSVLMHGRLRNHRLAGLSERAANGSRTRDLKLGKLALYQLSYRRAMLQTAC